MQQRSETALFNSNRFKLGLFSPNCSGGLSTLKTELWDGSWENNLKAARLADEAGLEFILPLGRWHGLRGWPAESEDQGHSLETVTWASGILASTRNICVFGTLHVTFISPVFAAKMIVTADHIGQGRFALNIVTGSEMRDFMMFGVPNLGNAERYAYTDEWVTIVKRAWSESEPFDFDGTYFHLKWVLEKPKPYGGTRPVLVCAASSAAGQQFAVSQTDCLFMFIKSLEALPAQLAAAHKGATRRITTFASGHMVCRRTRNEAEAYYDYVVNELGDWDAVERVVSERGAMPMATVDRARERLISGMGTYPVVGSYDDVAEHFGRMADAGLDGMAVGLFDYVGEFPMLLEVIERLERSGLRSPRSPRPLFTS